MNSSGHCTLQLSARRIEAKRLQLRESLVVLSPGSRERINNEVRGRVSEGLPSFPAISRGLRTTRANLIHWQISNSPKHHLFPRFNEPLAFPRPIKAMRKAVGSEQLLLKSQKKPVCCQISQTDFPLEDCEPWTVTDLARWS
jgi:hypothetical protein